MDYPFGTDGKGRNLLAVMVYGTALTLKIGLIAGILGVLIGTVLAFVAAYHGGWVDWVVRVFVDVLITVPALLVLVVVASSIRSSMSTTVMAVTIALLAWREPARKIRAQVLVLRESQYVMVARLNGASALRIIFLEMMPNLLPYLSASLVVAVAQAVLASVGLEALGLGTPSEPTLGMTIYWLMNELAFLLGLWWWILAPITVLVMLFVGLYLLTVGIDELANPRLAGAKLMSAGLSVRDLAVNYHTDAGAVAAVDRVSFDVGAGTRLGIVGESGSGKTTTALALIQMLRPPGRVDGGAATVDGLNLVALSPDEMRGHRLRTVSYIPQGAMNSLNPVLRIGRQMRNVLVDHDERPPGGDYNGVMRGGARRRRPGAAGRRAVSARAFRRHEAARLHRHGHPARPQGDHCRRANQRARRGDPAAGDGDAWPACRTHSAPR